MSANGTVFGRAFELGQALWDARRSVRIEEGAAVGMRAMSGAGEGGRVAALGW